MNSQLLTRDTDEEIKIQDTMATKRTTSHPGGAGILVNSKSSDLLNSPKAQAPRRLAPPPDTRVENLEIRAWLKKWYEYKCLRVPIEDIERVVWTYDTLERKFQAKLRNDLCEWGIGMVHSSIIAEQILAAFGKPEPKPKVKPEKEAKYLFGAGNPATELCLGILLFTFVVFVVSAIVAGIAIGIVWLLCDVAHNAHPANQPGGKQLWTQQEREGCR